MSSQYDSIKTPKDLLLEVTAHGLSTKREDICRAQDIFGRAPISDLAELAKESYSTFYMVLFNIWNWEDAARFYNEHTLGYPEEIRKLEEEKRGLVGEVAHQKEQARIAHDNMKKEMENRREARAALHKTEAELHDRDMTILELKAELYDYMKREKEAAKNVHTDD